MKTLRAGLVSLSNSPFLRNVAAVAGGTAAAQAIAMAFAPFITRLYGPEAFGVQGTFLSLIAIVTPLSALAYPIAIVLPKSDMNALALKRLSILVALGIAITLLLALVLLFDPLASLLGDELVAPFLWLLPVVAVLAAWFQVTQQWLIRNERFKVLAGIAILQAFLVNSARVGLGLLSATSAMLVAVTVAGLGFHALMQSWGGRGRQRAPEPIPDLVMRIRQQAMEHKNFPLFRAPEMILNAISESLPVLMLAAAFGPAEAGFYTLARSMLYLPLNLIGQSVADVFFPQFNSRALNGHALFPALVRAVGSLAAVALPLVLIVYIVSPSVFSLFFGVQWELSGVYASLLCPWLFVLFVTRPCTGAISVLRLQRVQLMNTFFFLIFRIIVLFLGAYVFEESRVAVALFGLVGSISGISILLIVALSAKERDRNV